MGNRINLTGAECPRLPNGQLISKMKQVYGTDCGMIWMNEGVYRLADNGAGFHIGVSGAMKVINSSLEPLLSALHLVLRLAAAPQPTSDCDFAL